MEIERIARDLLSDFCPEALHRLVPLDVESLFEQYVPKRYEVDTGYEKLSPGIHGYTDPTNMRSAVSVDLVDASDSATKRFGRSTIGHEVGHCVLHARQFRRRKLQSRFQHDIAHDMSTLRRQDDLKWTVNPEWQAWEFCKSIFLPKSVLEHAVASRLTVRDISTRVDLNPAFVETRLRNLQLLEMTRAF
jgi:hypothetical protein